MLLLITMIGGLTLLAISVASCPINTHIHPFTNSMIKDPEFTITRLASMVTVSCRRAIRHSGCSLRRVTPLPPATISTSPCNDDYGTSLETALNHVGTSRSCSTVEDAFLSIVHGTMTRTYWCVRPCERAFQNFERTYLLYVHLAVVVPHP